ncbi:MAG: hypothetical protein CO118_12145, partial [Flavobacteriales bacterium CG_4_9_14_3_um_filter_32_8]
MKIKKIILVIPLLLSLLSLARGDQESDYHFTENKGQLNQKVKYHCKLHIGDVYFEKNQFTFDMYAAEDFDRLDQIRHQPNLRNDFGKNPFKIRKHAYRMKFLGSNLNSEIVSEKKLPYYKNYIKGNNPDNWQSNVSSFEK